MHFSALSIVHRKYHHFIIIINFRLEWLNGKYTLQYVVCRWSSHNQTHEKWFLSDLSRFWFATSIKKKSGAEEWVHEVTINAPMDLYRRRKNVGRNDIDNLVIFRAWVGGNSWSLYFRAVAVGFDICWEVSKVSHHHSALGGITDIIQNRGYMWAESLHWLGSSSLHHHTSSLLDSSHRLEHNRVLLVKIFVRASYYHHHTLFSRIKEYSVQSSWVSDRWILYKVKFEGRNLASAEDFNARLYDLQLRLSNFHPFST